MGMGICQTGKPAIKKLTAPRQGNFSCPVPTEPIAHPLWEDRLNADNAWLTHPCRHNFWARADRRPTGCPSAKKT